MRSQYSLEFLFIVYLVEGSIIQFVRLYAIQLIYIDVCTDKHDVTEFHGVP